MTLNTEKYFEVTLPESHALSARVPDPHDPVTERIVRDPNREVFRTQIAVSLKQTFGTDIFTLRETRFQNQLTYRFAVRVEQADAFRQKISELGLKLEETGGSKR